jgi:hypothetical protein
VARPASHSANQLSPAAGGDAEHDPAMAGEQPAESLHDLKHDTMVDQRRQRGQLDPIVDALACRLIRANLTCW